MNINETCVRPKKSFGVIRTRILSALFLICFTTPHIEASSRHCAEIAPHPRLLMQEGEERNVWRMIETYPYMERVHAIIISSCDSMLTTAPSQRQMQGKRLLAVSRNALKRIYYLSYGYRMTGREQYADRAAAEMKAVCGFTDWNPSHFLDVGEMVMALGIGYDWLYDYLDQETKSVVRQAIMEKGFDAADNGKHSWFYNSGTNWNQVCNAGLLYGALAIYDEAPERSSKIIARTLESNPRAMTSYAPDGVYPEGFGYWGYGTGFQVMLIAALESAYGTDYGLTHHPGFLESARFMQFMTAPGGDCFCFGDAERRAYCNPMMFWCASKTGDTSLLWLERKYLESPSVNFAEERLLPSLMVFASRSDLTGITAPANNFWSGSGEMPVFFYRSGWNDPTDTYLAIKGGSGAVSHAHLDAGSFVFEKHGVRWAMDLGMQSYITLEREGVDLWNGQQNGQRWEVFRLNNRNHNTLTINDNRHIVNGHVDITSTYELPDRKGAALNMSPLFAGDVDRAVREIWLDGNDDLNVVDIVTTGSRSASAMWVMVTPAQARITGSNTIELSYEGHTMTLSVEGVTGQQMHIWSNDSPNSYDQPNPGTCRIGFTVDLPCSATTPIKVKLKTENHDCKV